MFQQNQAGGLRLVYFHQLNFDKDFPRFRTQQGVLKQSNGEIVFPVLLVVSALERALKEIPLRILSRVVSISGSAQQHCSVYWNQSALTQPYSKASLYDNISNQLADQNCPSWMDASTIHLCKALDGLVPPCELKKLSGSTSQTRFTGVQMVKRLLLQEDSHCISHVSLLSNAMASVLCNRLVPMHSSDASGMNLMDIMTETWSTVLVNAHAQLARVSMQEFLSLLGAEPVKGNQIVGMLDSYFLARFRLFQQVKIVSFTGDNPSTTVGLRLRVGDCAISLGTSTTMLSIVGENPPSLEGHVMRNPMDPSGFLEMICFVNGSLVRDGFFTGSWDRFEALIREGMDTTKTVAFVYPQVEVTPRLTIPGTFCFHAMKNQPQPMAFHSLSRSQALVSLLHGQFLAIASRRRRRRVEHGSGRVIVTGGSAKSLALLQVLSNCMGEPVYRCRGMGSEHAACLGAGYRAMYGYFNHSHDFLSQVDDQDVECVAEPQNQVFYQGLRQRYPDLEAYVITQLQV